MYYQNSVVQVYKYFMPTKLRIHSARLTYNFLYILLNVLPVAEVSAALE